VCGWSTAFILIYLNERILDYRNQQQAYYFKANKKIKIPITLFNKGL
tara:strand:+ start:253 stop:393 length:141 start_codon:yes stop_codon:yes gene_type:complete